MGPRAAQQRQHRAIDTPAAAASLQAAQKCPRKHSSPVHLASEGRPKGLCRYTPDYTVLCTVVPAVLLARPKAEAQDSSCSSSTCSAQPHNGAGPVARPGTRIQLAEEAAPTTVPYLHGAWRCHDRYKELHWGRQTHPVAGARAGRPSLVGRSKHQYDSTRCARTKTLCLCTVSWVETLPWQMHAYMRCVSSLTMATTPNQPKPPWQPYLVVQEQLLSFLIFMQTEAYQYTLPANHRYR